MFGVAQGVGGHVVRWEILFGRVSALGGGIQGACLNPSSFEPGQIPCPPFQNMSLENDQKVLVLRTELCYSVASFLGAAVQSEDLALKL